jgi:DinB superfamily
MTAAVPSWLAGLEGSAPDTVACWRALEGTFTGLKRLRRELAARVHDGDAPRILAEQESIGAALERVISALPEDLLRAPGDEEDWNVAQAFAHTTAARRFLAAWAALDAAGEWPEDDPPVVTPSIPGPADASRERLLSLLGRSAESLSESARRIAGHETERCRVRHPFIGHLRCGDWLLFVGVHDLAHLEQLHRLAGTDA